MSPQYTLSLGDFRSEKLAFALKRLVLATFLLLFTPSVLLAQPKTSRSAEFPDSEVTRVLALIDKMPSWATLSLEGSEEEQREAARRAETMRNIASQIATFDTPVIREAIKRYELDAWAKGGAWDRITRLFVINKFLFNIPDIVRRDSPHFNYVYDGRINQPITGDQKDPKPADETTARYPWVEDKDGIWRIASRRGTSYLKNGVPPYLLGDFDYYAREFGRRKLAP